MYSRPFPSKKIREGALWLEEGAFLRQATAPMQGKIQPKFKIPTDSIQSPLKYAFPQWGRRRVKNGVSYKIFTGDGANKCATDGRSLII